MALNSSSFQNMNDRVLAEALRAGDPGAMATMYDHWSDDLFQYCWFLLRDRDAARVALRDALVVAQAHIGRLKEPELLRPWLYALARVECRRHRPAPPDDPDVTVARPDQGDADLRLTAWNAVMGLPALQREALELAVGRGLEPADVGLVLGGPPPAAQALLDRGRERLQQAVTGEILARKGGYHCPSRAAILGDWAGVLTPPLREGLARHAAGCADCSRHVPHTVSVAKVFGVLPEPEPPTGMRLRAITCFTDPELAGYRTFVARRAGRFGESGFPVADQRRAQQEPDRGTPRVGLWLGLVAGAAAVVAGAIFALGTMGRFEAAVPGAGTMPAQQSIPAVPSPRAGELAPYGEPITGSVRGVTPIFPLGTALRRGAGEARPVPVLFTVSGVQLPAGGGQPGGGQPGGGQGTARPRPTGRPTPQPTGRPTPRPTRTPGPAPTGTMSPSAAPSPGPSSSPSASAAPTASPTGTGTATA
jgi:DNA-directed RNA polymerase specialized sigma24 family protein